MCDKHQHATIETWITPEDSQHLSAKMVSLFPGDTMPEHTTGPEREEVIICIYGMLAVTVAGRRCIVSSGEGIHIPANTLHSVASLDPQESAQYAYVATKRRPGICKLPADIRDLNRKPFPETCGQLFEDDMRERAADGEAGAIEYFENR